MGSGLSSILVALYFGFGIAMVLGMRIADLLLILFGPAVFVIVALMVLFRRLSGR